MGLHLGYILNAYLFAYLHVLPYAECGQYFGKSIYIYGCTYFCAHINLRVFAYSTRVRIYAGSGRSAVLQFLRNGASFFCPICSVGLFIFL